MFTRSKMVDGKKYYYLVESYREGGKVKQRTLAYLGPIDNPAGAIEYWEAWISSFNKYFENANSRAEQEKQKLSDWDFENGAIKPKHGRYKKYSPRDRYWKFYDYANKLQKNILEAQDRLDKIRAAIKSPGV